MHVSGNLRLRSLIAGLALTSVALVAPVAHAALVSYSFVGTAGAGSSLNLGAGVISLSGATFTASGQMVNDVDVYSGGVVGDGIGFFAATSTYDFGALGAFTTNIGGDFYGQNCSGPASITCALLATITASAGFRIDFGPAVAGDPDFGIVFGTQTATGSGFVSRTQTNVGGDTLTLSGGALRSVTTSALTVPEPATLGLVGLALAGVGLSRRRKAG